jgi:hypothetical protein
MESVRNTVFYLEESVEQKLEKDNLFLGFYSVTDYLHAFIDLTCEQQHLSSISLHCKDYFNIYDTEDVAQLKKANFLKVFEQTIIDMNQQSDDSILILNQTHAIAPWIFVELKPVLEQIIHDNQNSGMTIFFLSNKPFNQALCNMFNDSPLEIDYEDINMNSSIYSHDKALTKQKAEDDKKILEDEFAELDTFVEHLKEKSVNPIKGPGL